MNVVHFLIMLLAYLLIRIAADVGRKEDSKVILLSWMGILQLVLITTAGFLLVKFG